MKKNWSKDNILQQLQSAYYACNDPRMTGFVTWPIKQELYEIYWQLEELLAKCPKFSTESDFLKEHEHNKLVDMLSKKY